MSEIPKVPFPFGRILSDIAHDVRGAAGGTAAWIDVLRSAGDDAARARAIAELRRSLTRAVRLAEDLTDAVALVEGDAPRPGVPLDLVAVIAGAAERLAPEARARRVELRLDVPDGLTRVVTGDVRAWERTVDRLVGAALACAPRGNPFTLTVTAGNAAGPELAMPCGALELPATVPVFDAWQEPRPDGGAFPFGLAVAREQLLRAGGGLVVREDPPGRRLVAVMP